MRKVLFITGIRSEYDILYSVIRAVNEHPELEEGVIVTGAHLSPMYGLTVQEIEKDKFKIVGRIESLLNSDTPTGRVKSAALQLVSLIDFINQEKPSFIIAPMDREEALTVAIAGAYMQIPVVHIGGGDTAEDGNIDNAVRHAVTKLSHLHMVATSYSRDRVTKLGEEAWRVHIVGDPGLDRLLSVPTITKEELWSFLGFNPGDRPIAILIQHPIISSIKESDELMRLTMESLSELDIVIFVSYPNSDAGSQLIIKIIDEIAHKYPNNFYKYRNLSRIQFINLMKHANVLIGNSSCGIVEAPILKLPVVNIGPRQRGREHSNNVQFVDHDKEQIIEAVKKAIYDEEYKNTVHQCVNPYGDGHAGKYIADILAKQMINDKLLNKINTF